MKGKKIITILIIINLIFIGIIYNLINKVNFYAKKQIIKEMSEREYEDSITDLNTSHEDYLKSVEESKQKIAKAITDMGVDTSEQDTLEIMEQNIRSIAPKSEVKALLLARSNGYDNTMVAFYVQDNILTNFGGKNGEKSFEYVKVDINNYYTATVTILKKGKYMICDNYNATATVLDYDEGDTIVLCGQDLSNVSSVLIALE